jgi:hypothetical protein
MCLFTAQPDIISSNLVEETKKKLVCSILTLFNLLYSVGVYILHISMSTTNQSCARSISAQLLISAASLEFSDLATLVGPR